MALIWCSNLQKTKQRANRPCFFSFCPDSVLHLRGSYLYSLELQKIFGPQRTGLHFEPVGQHPSNILDMGHLRCVIWTFSSFVFVLTSQQQPKPFSRCFFAASHSGDIPVNILASSVHLPPIR